MDDLPSQPVASTSTAEPTLPPPGPSKTSLKKAAKKAERDATKLDRRRAERERKRAREAQRKQDIKEGKLTAEELEIFSGRKKLKNLRNESRKKGSLVSDVKCWKGGLIVDCGFDELMSENEIKSMGSQLSFIYSINRLSSQPFLNIVFSSFEKRLKDRLNVVSHGSTDRWPRISCLSENLSDFVRRHKEDEDVPFKGQSLVYLTADSEEELQTLKEDETYIIGGIVDRNRYKNLCKDKAGELGIRTARLPIGTYLAEMPTRKVLTVNQVFDILAKYIEMKDWKMAFEAVMPARKFKLTSKKERRGGKRENDDGEEDDDEEDQDQDDDAEIDEHDQDLEEEDNVEDSLDGAEMDEEEAMNAMS